MGAFFLALTSDVRAVEQELREATRVFAASDFGTAHVISGNGFLLYAYPKIASGASALREFTGGDFALATGTLIYDDKLGADAAEAFYKDYRAGVDVPSKAFGHFAVVLKIGSSIKILTDRFGGYNVYFDENRRWFSSSLLVIASVLKRLSLSKPSVFEYVFNGVVSGNDTLFDEIKLLPKDSTLIADAGTAKIDRCRFPPPAIASERPRGALITEAMANLDRYFASLSRAFGNRVRTALSGGYDSRLILAMLKRHQVTPILYVYGRPSDRDVQFSSLIANGEGLQIECVDKNVEVVSLERFPEIVEKNLYGVDGYSWAGIFDNGGERRERARRVEGDVVVLNGGGGEIFRNFFYLADRPYSCRQLLWSFYSQFDPRQCTNLFNSSEYYLALERKIHDLLGNKIDPLPRSVIEWLYHTFRCRSWDGRVNTINSRYGHTLLPFLESTITEHASCMPLRFKDHGAFESVLIRTADRQLSRYPSSYGHNFSGPPPLRRIVRDWGTHLRPPALRRFSFRIKNLTKARSIQNPYLQQKYVERVLPYGLTHLNRLFRVETISTENHLARILSLEVLLQRLDAKLAVDF